MTVTAASDRAAPAPVAPAVQNVLTSAITVPPLPGWAVRRERIERLIEAGARGPLTTVTGPPGAGKTMALASWAANRSRPRPIAWVTLDGFDNRPEVVWSQIVASLRRGGVRLSANTPPASARTARLAFLHRLISALAAQDPPVTVVLDDGHLLSDHCCLDELAYVLRSSRSGLHLLVAARTDPLLPLHRYRLTGELTEIRAADLAFSVPEARTLLARHGITVPKASLEALTRRTEGWAAGLRLAALSMERHPGPAPSAARFGAEDSAVTGYFAAEVLTAQPPRAHDVLLKTSILDRVSPVLAAELTGDGDAAGVLQRLAMANSFVRPAGSGWYRYHPVFAEVLRLQLRQRFPSQVARLHRQAARWLRDNGMPGEAVSQAVAAGDWQLAARTAVDALAVGALIDPRAALDGPPALDGRAPRDGERRPDGEPPPGSLIVEQLSGREREVLGHVAGMLSTAEVADEMYISVNTVKSHLKSIFRKLGTSRRGEAVRKARQLQLI